MSDMQPYVRLATRDDFEDLVILARRAFLHGPLVNFMADLEEVRSTSADAYSHIFG